jgi:DnaD/phage-associated family protein
MKGFRGFPAKGTLIKIPGLFFDELLPQIDNLAELKVTLYCFLRMQQKEGHVAILRRREIASDVAFLSGLGPRADQHLLALDEGLERAVVRGTLLHVHVEEDGRTDDLYFLNTPRGRSAVEQIEQGTWFPDAKDGVTLHATVERPNLYTLYEQNVGPLTPLIAEHLRDFEETYPEDWIREAIEIAVVNNVHRLSYIEAILKRWRAEGRPVSDDPSRSGDWYISGKYKDEIEY